MSEAQGVGGDSEVLVARYIESPRADLKDLIMVEYASLVERIARKFSGIEAFEDLVQVGFVGLLNALSKYDPKAGVRFNTYATYLVAGEIKHYLRDRSQTIRQPAWLQELRHRINRATAMLQSEYGRVPNSREIAEYLSISESAVDEVLVSGDMLKVGSLDATVMGDEDTAEVDRLDAADFCPEQLSVEDRVVLEHAMSQLRDLERQVLVLFHFESMNQTEIASNLGISCNYVSHILRQSLAKLRKILTVEEEKDRVLRRQTTSVDYDLVCSTTGVYTESFFKGRLQEELHRANADDKELALVLVRFEGLDAMRRFYGEQSVLDFLTDAAEFLKTSVRRLDIVCRYGETGFAIILPFTGASVGLVRQRLLKQAGSWTFGRLGPRTSVSVQIGQAFVPKDGKSVSDLVAAATPRSADELVANAA